MRFVLGTRKSKLALWQAERLKELLEERAPGVTIELHPIVTRGDRELDKPLPEIGGKGLFTAELEDSLRRGEIDFAQHSLKDLPTTGPDEFVLGAVCERESPFDALVSRGRRALADLPLGATVGSSSVRRAAQLLRVRPDLRIVSVRGNVDTRLRKLHSGEGGYQALVIAEAALLRLGLSAEITERFSEEVMLPAPGQGALALQCYATNMDALRVARTVDCERARAETDSERAFLRVLEVGCSAPVAALAVQTGESLGLHGAIYSLDGREQISVKGVGEISNAAALGERLAREAIARGALNLIGGRG